MVESGIPGWTASDGSIIHPSESHWHLVFVRPSGTVLPIVVGPLTLVSLHFLAFAQLILRQLLHPV
jgi:hypothetical protein